MKKTEVLIENLDGFSSTNVPVLQGTHWSENTFRVLQATQLNSELFGDFLVVTLVNQRVSSSSVASTLKRNRPPKKEGMECTGRNAVKRTLTSTDIYILETRLPREQRHTTDNLQTMRYYYQDNNIPGISLQSDITPPAEMEALS